jgi:Rieske 2Fe-2S family protein
MPHIAIESPRTVAEFEERVGSAHQRWQRLGLATRNVPVRPENRHHVIRFPFKQGFVTQTMDGQLVAPLLGRLADADSGIVAASILPNFWLEASVDYAILVRLTPAGARRTEIQADWLVREDAREGTDFDVERVTQFWATTLAQDWKLCENTQKGIESRWYVPGPFAPGITANSSLGERGPQAFVEWYLQQLV